MILDYTEENITRAAELLKNGDVVAFPTETVYGLGAIISSDSGLKKIFELKGRPAQNPLIVHVADMSWIDQVADISDSTHKNSLSKLEKFWPGPLSVVLPKESTLSPLITAGKDSVAVRVPSHPVAQALLRACGEPIAAPSANRSTNISPTQAAHVESEFGNDLEFILEGGSSAVGIESTVFSLIHSPPLILRPGAITFEELSAVLGDVAISDSKMTPKELLSPGMMERHYAPKTPLLLLPAFKESLTAQHAERIGFISFSREQTYREQLDFAAVTTLSSSGNLQEVASSLFAALRDMDQMELDLIVLDTCDSRGLGRAIMDRITRAAAPKDR